MKCTAWPSLLSWRAMLRSIAPDFIGGHHRKGFDESAMAHEGSLERKQGAGCNTRASINVSRICLPVMPGYPGIDALTASRRYTHASMMSCPSALKALATRG